LRRCTNALRRSSVAAVVLATALVVGGSFIVGSSSAGATGVPTGSISATSAPPIPSTGTAEPAGSLTVTLSAGSLPSGSTLALQVEPSTGSGYIDWDDYHIAAHTISVEEFAASTTYLDIELGAKDPTDEATIDVTQVSFNTDDDAGSVVVTARMSNGVTFAPSTAIDGSIVKTPPKAPTSTITARSRPDVYTGSTSGAGGEWTLTMSGDSATGSGWKAGAALTIDVAPPSGTNCAGAGYLYFVGTPTVTVEGVTGASATPTVAASLAGVSPCDTARPNELRLTFENAVYFDSTIRGTVTVTISGVHYAVGTTTTAMGTGDVQVSASFSGSLPDVTTAGASNATIQITPTAPATPPATPTGSGTGGSSPTQNGGALGVKADTPAVTVLPDAYDARISPVEVVGTTTAHVPAGYVCLSLSDGSFDTAATPAVAVAAGDGVAGGTATYQEESGTGASIVEFQVSKASTTADRYSVSGLAVNAPADTGRVDVKVTRGTNASCAQDTVLVGSTTAFTVSGTPVTRIYGATPDATAAAELEHQFDAQGTACPGRSGARPVVLATDARYPDALASAYLASSLGTGELLTPITSLSAATADAIRLEGITQVYIVGGPLAVSTGVAQQLESTLAYNCGGTAPLTSAGPVHIEVTRIAGTTQYDTAEWVAEYPPAGTVGSLDVTGAYVGSDRTGGTGRYNDTTGNGSAAPATSSTLPTAIVATGTAFQDAESASVLAYADRLPILLTTPTTLSPQATSVISDLGIKQVVVMGGPLAVSDDVVSSLEALGVSVLRVAGHTATDTAVQLADFEMGQRGGHLGAGWTGNGGVTVARGDFYSDGLAGAIVAAGAGPTHPHGPEPLVLCQDPSAAGPYLSSFLTGAGRTGIDGNAADRIATLTVLGGPDAVSPSVVATMTADL
jgi:putative cell wall-binding protein